MPGAGDPGFPGESLARLIHEIVSRRTVKGFALCCSSVWRDDFVFRMDERDVGDAGVSLTSRDLTELHKPQACGSRLQRSL